MKKFFIIFLLLTFSLPLCAQDIFIDEWGSTEAEQPVNKPAGRTKKKPVIKQEDKQEDSSADKQESSSRDKQKKIPRDKSEESQSEQVQRPSFLSRKSFEFGIDLGAGLDNDVLKINDFLKKDVIVDLNQLGNDVGENGLNLNLIVAAGFFVNFKNIGIIKSNEWDFGFFAGADGDVKLNVPKSLFTFISEGNADPENRALSGMISAQGDVFAAAGLRSSARFGKLRVGLTPAAYTPLVFIPKSGINYELNTDEDISVSTSGDISIYSPFVKDGEWKFGVDLSAEGEFALFSFLDIGGSVSNISLFPAVVEKRMRLTLNMDTLSINGGDLIKGTASELPELNFDETYDTEKHNVLRPMRFGLYIRLKPFANEFLVIKPNVGFSMDMNSEEKYFNAGLAAQLSLLNLIIVNLSTNYEEAIWTHRLGLAVNLRFFELDLNASLRSETFTGSFQAQGFGLNLGLRFGY